jgi:NAD-dependent deacetylase
MEDIKSAADIIREVNPNIALTGAGISAESGIDTFRGPDGLWSKYDLAEYATIDAFRRDPEKVWKLLGEMNRVIRQSAPNAAHEALADLEDMGYLEAVITQNIDSLHQAAGNKKVFEFHGSDRQLVCLDCGRRFETDERTARGMPPRCDCGSVLKPDLVLFGEGIPPEVMAQSYAAAETCGCMLVVGTSAVVYPAAQLPLIAKEGGAKIIEINPEPSNLTSFVTDIFLQGRGGDILPGIVAQLKESK